MNVLLLSGGLDSATILYLKRDVLCVSIDYGQDHVAELEAAASIARLMGVERVTIDLSGVFCKGSGLVGGTQPVTRGRNLLFIAAIAAMFPGAEKVYVGSCADDQEGFPDCRPPFLSLVDEACFEAYGLSVEAPLIDRLKADYVREYWPDPLYRRLVGMTISCYKGTVCGACLACQVRKGAIPHE